MESKIISIKFFRKRIPVGLLLGIICFALLIMEGRKLGYAFGSLLLLVFPVILAIKIETEKKSLIVALNILWGLMLALVTLLWSVMSIYLTHKALLGLSLLNLALNFAIFFVFVSVFIMIFADWKKAFSFASIILSLIVAVAWLVWEFSGTQFLFTDIFSAKAALNVLPQYSLLVNLRAATGISLYLLVLFSQFSIPHMDLPHKAKTRILSFAITACLAAFIYSGSANTPIKLWQNQGYTVNGFFLNFYLSIKESFIIKPEGYGEEKIQELENNYTGGGAAYDNDAPNIIIIMNESFSDLSVLGNNFATNKAVMPFFNSLQENTIRGYAYSSVFGGGTANSEFEVLTGLSMAMLPNSSIPYEQYIKKEIYALPVLLNELGYKSIASHPYHASGWARSTVYPLMGFSEATFIEDYPKQDFVRYYISDLEMYKYLLNKLNEKEQNEKLFIMGITMQNHGGYDSSPEEFTKTIELEGVDASYPRAEEYLSLINLSDAALEYLLTELERYEEKTVLLFFGDHFPSIEKELFDEIQAPHFLRWMSKCCSIKFRF